MNWKDIKVGDVIVTYERDYYLKGKYKRKTYTISAIGVDGRGYSILDGRWRNGKTWWMYFDNESGNFMYDLGINKFTHVLKLNEENQIVECPIEFDW